MKQAATWPGRVTTPTFKGPVQAIVEKIELDLECYPVSMVKEQGLEKVLKMCLQLAALTLGRWVVKLGRWVAKVVALLLDMAALWVRFQTCLKNTKWAT